MMHTQVLSARLETLQITGDSTRAPLVFLHEGLGSVAMWRDWPQKLCAATGRAGLVFSRRGYGQSDPIADVRGTGRLGPDYMQREALEILPALLTAHGLTHPVLVGHSDGATIALLYASRFPVAACIAMAPHVTVEDAALRSIEAARTAFEHGALRSKLAKFHADVDCAFWQWNDVWLSEAFRSMDIREDCRRISAPLLLVQGFDDAYGTMAQVDEVAARVPHAQVLKLEACGHSPHKDQEARVTRAIAEFAANSVQA
jgi:pimeloyl-ACP methyl ester carboxylesterase